MKAAMMRMIVALASLVVAFGFGWGLSLAMLFFLPCKGKVSWRHRGVVWFCFSDGLTMVYLAISSGCSSFILQGWFKLCRVWCWLSLL